ncbi:MAG: DNA topoisomerase VI subunit B, partial [Phycisphaerae bacterium]
MAARDSRTRAQKLETPSLFDYMDRAPAVKIGGVRPAFVESAAIEDDAPPDDTAPQEVSDDDECVDDLAPDDASPSDEADVEPAPDADTAQEGVGVGPVGSTGVSPVLKTRASIGVSPVRAPPRRRRSPRLPAILTPAAQNGEEPTDSEASTLTAAASVKTRKTRRPNARVAEKPAGRAPAFSKRGRPVTAESLAAKQRDISVSEFFAKNRHLLGFDNKRKALLTTVKEAVDNSLDACEEAHILPELHIRIDQLAEDRFRVSVRDNGPGIVKAQIPNIFGKLLYGSRFHRLKMARGQQGIGISAAGMYGVLTTGKSVHITSRTGPKKVAHHFQIQIDTAKNRPDVVKDEEVEVSWERGTEVTIELIASYSKGKQSVDEYVEQTAIANPHALIYYVSPTREHRDFPRGTEDLPAETKEIKPHPHGIELGVLMKMLKESKGVKLSGFLQRSFCRVSQAGSDRICQQANLSPRAAPNTIGTHDVEKLYEAMQSVRIMAPPIDCLAPIGVRNLLAGLLKEVKAEFYTATTRSPAVYRGNPFQIEIALAYGGNLATKGGAGVSPAATAARLIRFANRVPLLYQQSSCAAYKSVLDVDWRNYGLSQPGGSLPTGPLVVMVHMASVWVPFTSESKEAIADYDEIRREMKLALQECGRKLSAYVRRRRRQKMEAQRRDIFGRYIPDVAEALANITGASEQRILRDLRMTAKTRTAEADVVLDENGKPVDVASGLRTGREVASGLRAGREVAADLSSAGKVAARAPRGRSAASGLRAGREVASGLRAGREVASGLRAGRE